MRALILLSLISFNASAIECDWQSERKFRELQEELILKGKGIREINDVLLARIDICKGKCGEQISTFQGLCMAKVKGSK